MRNVYAYIRVSTVKQGDKGSSLVEQRLAIEAYAKRHELTISEWFEEKETAAKRGRTVFTRMLGLLLKGRTSGVIIHKIDRGARNLRDWADLGALVDKGIEIHFAHESLDMNTRGGRLAADIQAVVAADFIRNLRDEVRKGFKGRLRQGLYPLPAPVGYKDQGKGLPKTADPVMGPLVERCFRLYATGQYNLRTLGEELFRVGLRNRRGGRVTKNGLSTLLNNEFYIGVVHIRRTGERYQGIHEPLIGKTLFDRVQAVLDGRTQNTSVRNYYPYRKTLLCSTCRYSLIAERQKGHVYYRCHSRDCLRVCVRQDAIHEQIDGALKRLQLTPREYALLEEEFYYIERDRSLQQSEFRKSVELRCAAAESRLSRLVDAYVDRMIDKVAYDQKRAALLHERSSLLEELHGLEGETEAATQRASKFLELLKTLSCNAKEILIEDKRDLLKQATSNLQIAGKKLVVDWSNPFRLIASRHKSSLGAPLQDAPRTFTKSCAKKVAEYVSTSPEFEPTAEDIERWKVEQHQKRYAHSYKQMAEINRKRKEERSTAEPQQTHSEDEKEAGEAFA